MPRIRPFDGYLVSPAHAAEVVSPAYDAVSPEMRREFADAHPNNYLNTMRQLADFPADAQPSVDELLQHNKTNLRALLTSGAFNRIETPSLFIYQLATATHTQTGVVCEVSVDEYAHGRLRKHESTRRDKEDLLAMYQAVVGVASSPICLAYRHDDAIESLLDELTRAQPALDFASEDGVAQRIWRVDDAAAARRLQALFARIDITYLTDGHHRAAAGERYAKMRRAEAGDGEVRGDGGHAGDGEVRGDGDVGDGDAHGEVRGDGDALSRHPRNPHPRHPRSPLSRHPRSPLSRHPRSPLSGGGDGGRGDGGVHGVGDGGIVSDGDDADAPYNQLLVALFSARQLNLLPFHRAVKDLNGLTEAQLVAALQRDFEVQRIPGDTFTPTRHGEFGMLLGDGDLPRHPRSPLSRHPRSPLSGGGGIGDGAGGDGGDGDGETGNKNPGNWYRLRIRDGVIDAGEPVDALDVSILQNHILAPIFGIHDARADPRLDYISGVAGVAGLRQKCADGWAACFACFPTSIEQLMQVADSGGLMPPKSTYFDPKARSGIFIRPK